MNVHIISLDHLLYAFIPVLMVAWIYYRWSLNTTEVGISVLRMTVQLLLIGYVLAWIFEVESAVILGLVLLVMALVSTWIALRKVGQDRRTIYFRSLVVITLSSLFILAVVVGGVLSLNPLGESRVVIPLAGMIFSSAKLQTLIEVITDL